MPNRVALLRAEIEAAHPGAVIHHRGECGFSMLSADGRRLFHKNTTGPWHWQQPDDTDWREIDTDLETRPDPTWKHGVKSARFDSVLTDDGRRRFYPRRWISTEWVEFGALEFQKPDTTWAAVPTGVMSRVENRLVGTDSPSHRLRVGFTGVGSRTHLTIKNATIARPIRWAVTLHGLLWDQGKLVSLTDAEQVGFIRPPTWRDSSVRSEPRQIPWGYGQAPDGNWYATLTPDFGAAVYPVEVDPDYTISASLKDGWWRTNASTFNATDNHLQFGPDGAAGWSTDTFLQFLDIYAPQGATCSVAHLHLRATQYGHSGAAAENAIWCVDEDNAAAPTTYAEALADCSAHDTETKTDWDFTTTIVPNTLLTTSDFATHATHVFARAGWLPGYALLVHIDHDSTDTANIQTVASYDNVDWTEPILSLTVLSGAPGIVFPTNAETTRWTSAKVTSAASLVINKPSGLANGDVLLLLAAKDDDPAFSNPIITGFTNISVAAGTTGDDIALGAAYKVVKDASAEGSTYTINTGDTGEAICAVLLCVSGVDHADVLAGTTVNYYHNNGAAAPNPASMTTDAANAEVVVLAATRVTTTAHTQYDAAGAGPYAWVVVPPAGYTMERLDLPTADPGTEAEGNPGIHESGSASGHAQMLWAHKFKATLGAEDPGTFTAVSISGKDWEITTFALKRAEAQTVTLPLLSACTLYAPTVQPTVTLPLLAATTLYAPAISMSIVLPLLTAVTLYGPTVAVGRVQYLYQDGSGDYALSDYTTAITGDLDVRVYIRATDWERDAGDGYQILACQGGWSDGNWWLSLRYGKIVFVMGNTAGSWTYAVWTDDALTGMDGVDVWVRATHDVDNGAGGNTVEIYRSVNGIDWVNLPSAGEPSGTYTRYNSTTPHVVGRLGPGAEYGCFQGRIYEAQIRSGIDGTLVANPVFSSETQWWAGLTAADDDQANTWTLTGGSIFSPITLPLLTAVTLYAPTVALEQAVALPLLSAATLFEPTVLLEQTVTLPLLAASTLYAPIVKPSVILPLLSAATLYAPTLQPTVTLPLLSATTLFAPTVTSTVTLPFLAATALYAPAVQSSVTLPLLGALTLFEPTVSISEAGPQTVTLPLLAAATLFEPVVAREEIVTLPLLAATTLYAPALGFSLATTSIYLTDFDAYTSPGSWVSGADYLAITYPDLDGCLGFLGLASGVIPPGSIIDWMAVILYKYGADGSTTDGVQIDGSLSPRNMPMSRGQYEGITPTTAKVYATIPGTAAGTPWQTPNLAAIFQEIVDSTWTEEDTLVLAFRHTAVDEWTASFYSYDYGSHQYAPQIKVLYRPAPQITLPLLAPVSLWQPTLLREGLITLPLLAATTLYAPAVQSTVALPLLAPVTLWAPTLSPTVTLPLLAATTLYAPQIQSGVTLPFLASVTLYAPTLSICWTLTLPLLSATTLYAPAVQSTVTLPLLTAPTLYAPSVQSSVTLPLLSPASLFSPLIAIEQTVTIPLLATLTLYAPEVRREEILTLPLLAATELLIPDLYRGIPLYLEVELVEQAALTLPLLASLACEWELGAQATLSLDLRAGQSCEWELPARQSWEADLEAGASR